ncbi:MAG: lysophospholipid acyltransferase family protein [Patescibacteria group bacterium]|nr:lysophospholipid acyltransferase family protein [Patescibacteria group bacterium]
MPYGPLRYTIIPLLRKGVARIEGAENLPKQSGFIVAANHSSWLDSAILISVIFSLLKKQVFFVAATKKYASLGALPVDKKNPAKVVNSGLKLLASNQIIGIFPEGRANGIRTLNRGKTGVTRLALWSGYPVVPAGIIGTSGVNPLRAIWKFFSPKRNIQIIFGQPITFPRQDKTVTTYKELCDRTTAVMEKIAGLCGKLYKH